MWDIDGEVCSRPDDSLQDAIEGVKGPILANEAGVLQVGDGYVLEFCVENKETNLSREFT